VDLAKLVVRRHHALVSLFNKCTGWQLFMRYWQATENGIANSVLQGELYADRDNPQAALTTDVSKLNKLIARLGLRVAAHGRGCRRLAILPNATL
jgi:hypothetical protein